MLNYIREVLRRRSMRRGADELLRTNSDENMLFVLKQRDGHTYHYFSRVDSDRHTRDICVQCAVCRAKYEHVFTTAECMSLRGEWFLGSYQQVSHTKRPCPPLRT